MKCPKCGGDNPDGEVWCRHCAEPLAQVSDVRDELEGSGDATQATPAAAEDVTQPLKPGTRPSTRVPERPGTPATGLPSPTPTPATGTPPPSQTPSPASATTPSQTGATTGILQPATIFAGRYEILQLLGEGGMGRVYKARDTELDRLIALKTIRTERGEEAEAIQRFKQELILARQITHKNVVRIFDLGEAEGTKFFTMEFIEGEDLKDMIRRRGKIPADEAMAIATQVLGALQEAHDQGVVHRDLKPENIMIDEQGVPHIMDFGIARSIESEGMTLTATGMVIGTPDYISPEQVRGEKASGQSDLFSFGVILYEMLTGEVPYKADNPVSKVMMRLTQKVQPPREINLDIPRYLEAIVLKCMEVDPALRYKSAVAVQDDLERERVARSPLLRLQRAVARRKGALAAVAAVLVMAVAGYLVVTRQAMQPAPLPEVPVTTLAILPFTNATGSEELEWMRSGLAEMLVTDISQSKYLRPVAGERVFNVLGELGIAEQTRFDEATLDSISERTRADSVLYGQFVESESEDALRIDLTLRQAGSGVPIPLKVEGSSSEVFSLVDRITQEVKAQMDLTPDQLKGDEDRPIAEVSTASLAARRAYELGLAQLRRGSNQDAIDFLQSAADQDPDFAMAHAKLAEAYVHAGHFHEAEAAVEKAVNLSETAPLPLAQRYQIHATAALVHDDYERAAESLSELAKLYPEDPDILLSLARSYEELGHLPESMEAYTQVVDLSPGQGAAVLGLGRVQVMSGHHDEAVQGLQEALDAEIFHGDPEALGMAHSILGVAHRRTGELDEAVVHLNLSLEHRRQAGDQRGQATTLLNLAGVYDYQDKIREALAAEREVLDIAREMGNKAMESQAWNSMGNTYEVAEDLDKALDAYRQSLALERERGDDAEIAARLDRIGHVYRIRGQYDDAIVYFEQAGSYLEHTGDLQGKAVNLVNIGEVRQAQGQYDKAIEAFLEALPILQEVQQQLGIALVQKRLAEIYINQGRYADAHAALQQTLEIDQQVGVTEHDLAEDKAPLALLYIALGQLEAAERELNEAVELSQHDHGEGHLAPELLLGRAELNHLHGRQEEAAADYKAANIQANLSGRKEVAVKSRVELGLLYLQQGKLPNAERLLERTRREAADAWLRPLEAEALTALARVYLAKGDAQAAAEAAREAVSIATKFSGRPTIYQAQALRAEALQRLGRPQEAVEACLSAAAALGWIRGGLQPEQVDSFMARGDIQRILSRSVEILEGSQRTAEAESLRKWIGATT